MTFFRVTVTVTSGGAARGRLRGVAASGAWARRGAPDRFVPWVTEVPPTSGPTRRPGCGPAGSAGSAAGYQVLAGRAEREVGIDAVAEVDQLQRLGQQPRRVHGPHAQPQPDAVGLADEGGAVVRGRHGPERGVLAGRLDVDRGGTGDDVAGVQAGQAGVAAADARAGFLGDQHQLGRAAERRGAGAVDDDRPGAGLAAPGEAR